MYLHDPLKIRARVMQYAADSECSVLQNRVAPLGQWEPYAHAVNGAQPALFKQLR